MELAVKMKRVVKHVAVKLAVAPAVKHAVKPAAVKLATELAGTRKAEPVKHSCCETPLAAWTHKKN